MTQNKRYIGISLVCALIIILLMVVFLQSPSGEQRQGSNIINTEAELVDWYANADELKESAELIAQVTVEQSESFTYSGVVFTVSEVEINKQYQSNSGSIKTLRILETGGMDGDREFLFNGNKTLQKGDKAILYLKKYVGPVTKNAYLILGAYQGKFLIKDGNRLVAPLDVAPGITEINDIEDLKLNAK